MHLPPLELEKPDLYLQMGSIHVLNSNILDPFADLVEPDIYQPSELTAYQNQAQDDNGISLDTRRLQTQHTTEGFRDGITAGKVESIQTGFDQGFNLGANVGLKAGWILGLVEGVAGALKETGHHSPAHTDQLLSNAVKELSTESLFSGEYWASNGSWKYPVKGSRSDGEILFEDVASEHPVIIRWEKMIDQEVRRWSLDQNLPILGCDASQLEAAESPAGPQIISRQAVDW
ncbi:hypothetical protein F4781DRAFT_418455 [Annulohypoxylon bovei var. microspora]|nr:hypothetical protein F4781DRAFT_418455 [Annulohypoxylon bovei var. microspora]